jgi:hypothetical protein
MTTTTVVSSPAKQAVFCSIVSVRRHCEGRYTKHEFDNRVRVDREDNIPPNRASWPKSGERWFLMSKSAASRIAGETPFLKPGNHEDHIDGGISEARPTETEYFAEGPRW